MWLIHCLHFNPTTVKPYLQKPSVKWVICVLICNRNYLHSYRIKSKKLISNSQRSWLESHWTVSTWFTAWIIVSSSHWDKLLLASFSEIGAEYTQCVDLFHMLQLFALFALCMWSSTQEGCRLRHFSRYTYLRNYWMDLDKIWYWRFILNILLVNVILAGSNITQTFNEARIYTYIIDSS
jgi:hypothetical protein